MLSLFGFLVGLCISIVLYYLQKTVGIVGVPEGFAVDAYPVVMNVTDVLIILVIVSVIGFAASFFPAKMASKASSIFKYN